MLDGGGHSALPLSIWYCFSTILALLGYTHIGTVLFYQCYRVIQLNLNKFWVYFSGYGATYEVRHMPFFPWCLDILIIGFQKIQIFLCNSHRWRLWRYKTVEICKINWKQAGAELGQAQIKLELGLTLTKSNLVLTLKQLNLVFFFIVRITQGYLNFLESYYQSVQA